MMLSEDFVVVDFRSGEDGDPVFLTIPIRIVKDENGCIRAMGTFEDSYASIIVEVTVLEKRNENH